MFDLLVYVTVMWNFLIRCPSLSGTAGKKSFDKIRWEGS